MLEVWALIPAMATLIIHHDDCLRHETGPGHPERPERISAVLEGLEGLKGLEYLTAPRADAEQVARAHDPEYSEWLEGLQPEEGEVTLPDGETRMSPGSMDACWRASGAICFAIDEVLKERARRAFCVTRPPGHHSGIETAMGFCLFNHVAVGARHALAQDGIDRVAIIDFDVHHGNGTQEIFESDPAVLYVSSHQMPLFPGTGHMDETGCGNVLNLPLPPGTGSAGFRRAWSTLGLPAVHSFQPDFILLSAGFDGHRRDPLGQLELEDDDFRWLTGEVIELAGDCARGRVISTLEGGYDPQALRSASRAHVESLG